MITIPLITAWRERRKLRRVRRVRREERLLIEKLNQQARSESDRYQIETLIRHRQPPPNPSAN